jgi:hypothetical protein
LQEPEVITKHFQRQGGQKPRDFQDTEVAEKGEKISPLSSTQYGDLI